MAFSFEFLTYMLANPISSLAIYARKRFGQNRRKAQEIAPEVEKGNIDYRAQQAYEWIIHS